MSPKTVQKLKENIPELRELIAFLQSEAEKLNDLSALKDTAPVDYAFQVGVRLHAKKTLDAMLAPLLTDVDSPVGIDPREFVV